MAYATVDQLTEFFTMIADEDISAISWPSDKVFETNLLMAAGEIDMNLQSSNQLTGTKSATGLEFLKLLNLVGAALVTEFPNARQFTPETMTRFAEWKANQMELLRKGQLIVVEGETNKDYPAFATSEQAYTSYGALQIRINYFMKNLLS